MNLYIFIPLVTCVAYVPLLVSTLSTWPWSRQHRLLFLFLFPAVIYSITDYMFRSNFFPTYTTLLTKISSIIIIWAAVQLYCFTSSYFPDEKRRWLIFAFGLFLLDVILVFLNYLPESLIPIGNIGYLQYGISIIFIVVPILILLARNVFIFLPRLRNQENPVIHNQTASLLLSLAVFAISVIIFLFPVSREIPLLNIGNLVIAIILSYAVGGHKIADIRFILRRGLIWVSIGIVGIAFYIGLLQAFYTVLNTNLSVVSVLASTMACILSLLSIYKLRELFARIMGKAFQGPSFYYRRKLIEYADNIRNVFSLKEQGGELLTLVIGAVVCRKAGLLFVDAVSGDFKVQYLKPGDNTNSLFGLILRRDNPITGYLKRHRAPLTWDNMAISPEFMGLWRQEKKILEINQIELFIPLINLDNLIGILILDKKKTGRYSLEDLAMLQDITGRISVSMEKEYLTEQMKQREEELSIINRSSAIIASSLDIQGIYNSFITELQKVVDVDWAAIGVIEGPEMYLIAVYPEIGSTWKVGERIPLKGAMGEWVAAHRTNYIDHDLVSEVQVNIGMYYSQHGIRSIIYQPIIISNEIIGTLIVASRQKYAYNQRHLKLLEQLATQIAIPIGNARLYAKTARMARVDELTGLLNRRSLDEVLPSEINRHSMYGGVFSLVIVDLDSLKTINDHYGHLAGDKLLRDIGSVIKNAIRDSDQAFRYGGDEFAILLPQTPIDAAIRVAERVREQVSARVIIGTSLVTVSLGIASWPVDGLNVNDIIAAADAALYKAKRNGGNCCQTASVNLVSQKNYSQGTPGSQDSGGLSAN
jgi:diguanylate cyclase (GGDEF)-like protein